MNRRFLKSSFYVLYVDRFMSTCNKKSCCFTKCFFYILIVVFLQETNQHGQNSLTFKNNGNIKSYVIKLLFFLFLPAKYAKLHNHLLALKFF